MTLSLCIYLRFYLVNIALLFTTVGLQSYFWGDEGGEKYRSTLWVMRYTTTGTEWTLSSKKLPYVGGFLNRTKTGEWILLGYNAKNLSKTKQQINQEGNRRPGPDQGTSASASRWFYQSMPSGKQDRTLGRFHLHTGVVNLINSTRHVGVIDITCPVLHVGPIYVNNPCRSTSNRDRDVGH